MNQLPAPIFFELIVHATVKAMAVYAVTVRAMVVGPPVAVMMISLAVMVIPMAIVAITCRSG